MKNTDRFLIGIVAGILVLLAVAFAITIFGPKPAYKADDSPENVVHNYILALEREDYQRAYSYLDVDLKGYPPDLEAFVHDVRIDSWNFRLDQDHTITIESSRKIGSVYFVTIRESVFFNRGLFPGEPMIEQVAMQVVKIGEAWKLIAGERYFSSCWTESQSYCR